MPVRGDRVIERGKKHPTGEVRGSGRRCTMESCGGQKVSVRWLDGKLTYCCDRGLALEQAGTWRLV